MHPQEKRKCWFMGKVLQLLNYISFTHSFINLLIHSQHIDLYSTSSILPLRGAPEINTATKNSFEVQIYHRKQA